MQSATVTQFLMLAAMITAGAGCAAETNSTGDATDAEMDTGETEQEARTALPIRGEWSIVEVQGSELEGIGSHARDVPVRRTFARGAGASSVFDLDGKGDGTITGDSTCTLQIAEAGGRPSKATTPRAASASGLFGVINAVAGLVQPLSCPPGAMRRATVQVWMRRGFFGRPDPHLDANVGVLGERKSADSAERECRALRGARFVNLVGSAACIGYVDGAGTELRMLIQRSGEIYVQRVTLRR